MTHSCLDEYSYKVLKRISPSDRVGMAFALTEFSRDLVKRVVRIERPDMCDHDVVREVVHRCLQLSERVD